MVNDAAAAPATRRFYRLVRNNPPSLEDFLSYAALGIRVDADDPETRRLSRGISVQATEAQARRRHRQLPHLGSAIAILEVPVGGPIRYERTTRTPGHHTLWGPPAILLRCVVTIVLLELR